MSADIQYCEQRFCRVLLVMVGGGAGGVGVGAGGVGVGDGGVARVQEQPRFRESQLKCLRRKCT